MADVEVYVPKKYAPKPPKGGSGEEKKRAAPRKTKSGKRAKKRHHLYANAPYGYRMLVSSKALKAVLGDKCSRVGASFHQFIDHFLRHKTVDIVRAADSVAKIQHRYQVGVEQVLAAVSTVFRAGVEELSTADSFEPQMLKAAETAVSDYARGREDVLAAKLKKAMEKQAEEKKPGSFKKKDRLVAKGNQLSFSSKAARKILKDEVADALAARMGEKTGDEKKPPTVSMSWSDIQGVSKLSLDVVRVYNLAQEVCSDNVSFTRVAAVALAGALNYLFEDIVLHAYEFSKDSKTLSYAHLQRSIISTSAKDGPRVVDPEAFKLLSPYLKNTPGLRMFRVEHSDPAWNFLSKTFPDRSLRPAPKRPRKEASGEEKPATKKAKKAKPAMPVAEPAAAEAAA
jgi:hypothetical protein